MDLFPSGWNDSGLQCLLWCLLLRERIAPRRLHEYGAWRRLCVAGGFVCVVFVGASLGPFLLAR